MGQRFTADLRTDIGWDGSAGMVHLIIELPDLLAADWRERTLIANLIRNLAAFAQGPDEEPDVEAPPAPAADLLDDPTRACRVCGCTDKRACITDGRPCGWAELDLCTACAAIIGEALAAATAAELDIDDIFATRVEGLEDDVDDEDAQVTELDLADAPGELDADELERSVVDVVDVVLGLNRAVLGIEVGEESVALDAITTVEVPDADPPAAISPAEVERAAMRLTPIEKLAPGLAMARELGIPGNRVGPYVKMARARGYLPHTSTSLSED